MSKSCLQLLRKRSNTVRAHKIGCGRARDRERGVVPREGLPACFSLDAAAELSVDLAASSFASRRSTLAVAPATTVAWSTRRWRCGSPPPQWRSLPEAR
jgi:hypothetical protein